MEAVGADLETGPISAHYRNPCLLLETPAEYERFFTRAGFDVVFSRLDAVRTQYGPEEAFRAFLSGAAVAYLSAPFYDVPVPEGYVESAHQLVREALARQADEKGIIEITFYRMFLLAVKPD